MMAEGTAALRAAAAHWSLAGDQQLLDILQNIHQRIILKCNETNARLEEMARGLRDANVNLQNVNNKFLALSNTQFVESRVYDDDEAELTSAPVANKEPPQLKDFTSDLSKLKQSIQILESYHEPLHILRDSDSDSDSDAGDDRLILKPRDLYSERPLPYIIGSRAWKSKWHAGLVLERSDSDSSVSRAEEAEQYSESEEDGEGERETGRPERKVSTGSSSAQSEAVSVSLARPTPSEVAAELARRLRGDAKLPEREPVYSEPETVVRKLYKPQQPVPTTIFPDEPPPLDSASSDDDIFAALRDTRPSAHGHRVHSGLFDFTPKTDSSERALSGRKHTTETDQVVNSEPPLFEGQPVSTPREREDRGDTVKKPIGGISLFGTNQHADDIGAAILRRNRRNSINSDDCNPEEVTGVENVKEVPEVKKERDIFDDLFAKSKKLNKTSAKIDVVPPKEEVKKKDAFSDLFDDIDDIFSTDIVNVQIKETKKDEQSLFADDGDLFAEVSKDKKDIEKEKAKVIEKSDLFDVIAPKVENNVMNDHKRTPYKVVKEIRNESKGLFDSDSDDGLFTSATKNNAKENDNKTRNAVEHKITDDIFGESDEGDGLFAKNKAVITKHENKNVSKAPELSKKALFDSDDELFTMNDNENKIQKDKGKNNYFSKAPEISRNVLFDSDDELFTDNSKETKRQQKEEESNVIKANKLRNNALLYSDDELFTKNIKEPRTKELDIEKKDMLEKNYKNTIIKKFKKPETKSLDKNDLDDSAEDLFKTKEKSKAIRVIESINNDIFIDDDELFKRTESPKASKIMIHDNFDSKSISNNKSFTRENESSTETAQGDTQSDVDRYSKIESEQVSSCTFNHPDVQTANILRTTRIASDEENTQTDKVKRATVDDSDDELFKITPETNLKEPQNNKTETVSLELPKPVKNDICTDIFDDAPPLFEKPKEAKKSRNVNALFDDDSDDEALFFKKNDVTVDETPCFSPSEEKFGIFFDEPPAIEVDFSQKPKIKDSEHKVEEVDGSSVRPILIEDVKIINDNTETRTKKDIHDTTDNVTKEPKKVGKLKPMNFNINVNTLLPGACPKKKQNENTDGQTASNEDLQTTDKIEHKLVKSISFDDPEILDNKLSKERAKIQVKRRPSTRRARKEAVRKSAIDLTDSSFDSSNDSSVNDSVKDTVVKTVYILNDDDIFGKATEKGDLSGTENTKEHLNIVDSDEELFKKPEQKDETVTLTKTSENKINNIKASKESTPFRESDDEVLFKNERKSEANKNEKKSFLDDDEDDALFRQTTVKNHSTTVDTNLSKSSSNTETNSKEIKKVTQSKSFLDSDDNDDLFTNKNARETESAKSNVKSIDEDLFTNANKGIETLGKAYETKDVKDVPAKVQHKMHSVFDDFPPQQVINTKPKEIKTANVEKPAIKSILDESSDEDDLFKAKTKLRTKRDAKSLFGDDFDDGDDLFGGRTVQGQKQEVPRPQISKEAISAEPVFVDPLSLFTNDE